MFDQFLDEFLAKGRNCFALEGGNGEGFIEFPWKDERSDDAKILPLVAWEPYTSCEENEDKKVGRRDKRDNVHGTMASVCCHRRPTSINCGSSSSGRLLKPLELIPYSLESVRAV